MNQPIEKPDADAFHGTDRLAEAVGMEKPPRLPFAVVGMGASAGGLEAYSEFFAAMPPESGMAFVLILHLPPERDSMLADILSKRTQMPVLQVEDGLPVKVNHVYVIRPGHTITIQDGALHLSEPVEKPGHQHPVDDFFRSLAEEQRERAICVVMSGMGSNGTAGAQAVKAVGGACIAQEPETAKFSTMPQYLIDSGMADFVLVPKDIPEVLIRYARHPYTVGAPVPVSLVQRDRQAINEILAVLRARTRHNFDGYKKTTLVRRIQRRMGLSQITKIDEYTRFLRRTPAEVIALADDLMIHVTGFFRDRSAWEALRTRVLLPLVAEREDGGPIRAWVSACSSGEEAYTLSMLLLEAAEAADKNFDIKVFATDSAERSLNHARGGVYPGGIEAEVSAARLSRFFDKDDSSYRIKKELRELVVFAPQNVMQDPPFSRLDICSCRNLLIYLEPDIQRRVLSLLHFGLRDRGVLFLGTSETINTAEELFEPVDKKFRIYRRIGPTRHGAIDFSLPRTSTHSETERADTRKNSAAQIAQSTARALLDRYTPPSIVIDRQMQAVYFHGQTERYLVHPSGEPTRDLMALVRESVRGAVRSAVHKAMNQTEPVMVRDGIIETPRGRCRVEVTATPLDGKANGPYLLVSFEERPEPSSRASAGKEKAQDRRQLEEELRLAREELQSTIEELQTNNEEMKASNEEVTSVNEELQSTNEELETSKEELQSLNEELTTVNAQLQAKMEELEATTNDLSSLLSSTDIAVVFLDRNLRIRRYTPPVRNLLNLIATDADRPLSDMALKFTDPDLVRDAEAVLEQLAPIEKEVVSFADHVYLRRALPYRTADNRIGGVVLTFVDITRRKRAEEELRNSEERYRLILDSVRKYAIFTMDLEGRIETWPAAAQRILGYAPARILGQPWSVTFTPEDRKEGLPERHLQLARERGSANEERWCPREDGSLFWASGVLSVLTDAEGKARGYVKVMLDSTERKQAETQLRESKRLAEEANQAKDRFLANVSHELRTPLSVMKLWSNMLKLKTELPPEFLREGIEAISRSADAQSVLIEDLFDASRIAAGKLRIATTDTDLAKTVRAGVEAVRPAAAAKGLEIIDDTQDVGIVRCDPQRIQQIVWNLVSNAVKFTPSGGRVEIRLRRFEQDVELRISDTGDGIPADFLPHVFERFAQAEPPTNRAKGGLGLGLAITRQLIELHGGAISVQSDGKGKGSHFTVRMPLPTVSAVPAEKTVASSEVIPANALHGARILLVEDDRKTCEALTAALKMAGASVTAAESAAGGIDQFKQARPEIILSDIGMPGQDGYEMIRALRKLESEQNLPAVPAIALSAYTNDKARAAALDSGFQLHLTKPIDPMKLILEILKMRGRE